jgi:hypothetical protein
MPVTLQRDLWSLVQDQYWIDPDELFAALNLRVQMEKPDYRTRFLIRDVCPALANNWGAEAWPDHPARRKSSRRLKEIVREDFEHVGLPSLPYRVLKAIDAEFFERVFRRIGEKMHHEVTVAVAGSASLILQGMLRRSTEGIDFVNEVPAVSCKERALLKALLRDEKIPIAHFQSHYLPLRWENRTHWHGAFGPLTVTLVDAADIFLSKLFSIREKDQHGLNMLLPQLNRTVVLERLNQDCASLLASPSDQERAVKNWYILTGEKALPIN